MYPWKAISCFAAVSMLLAPIHLASGQDARILRGTRERLPREYIYDDLRPPLVAPGAAAGVFDPTGLYADYAPDPPIAPHSYRYPDPVYDPYDSSYYFHKVYDPNEIREPEVYGNLPGATRAQVPYPGIAVQKDGVRPLPAPVVPAPSAVAPVPAPVVPRDSASQQAKAYLEGYQDAYQDYFDEVTSPATGLRGR